MFNLQNFSIVQMINLALAGLFCYLTIKAIILLKKKNKTIFNTYVVNYKVKRFGYLLYTLTIVQIIHYLLFTSAQIYAMVSFYPIFFILGPYLLYINNEFLVKKSIANVMRIVFIIYILGIFIFNFF